MCLSIFLSSGARELQRFVIPIPVHYLLKMVNLWKPLALLLGEIDICDHPTKVFVGNFMLDAFD